MSPEQMAGRRTDGRSDLYSLGVMLFQLLTGTLPFEGGSMAELMRRIVNEPAPDLRALRPDLRLTTLPTAPTGLTVITGLDRHSRVLAERRKILTEMESKALLSAFRFPFKN